MLPVSIPKSSGAPAGGGMGNLPVGWIWKGELGLGGVLKRYPSAAEAGLIMRQVRHGCPSFLLRVKNRALTKCFEKCPRGLKPLRKAQGVGTRTSNGSS